MLGMLAPNETTLTQRFSGHGRREQGSPLDFGILSKKGCFLNFEREKKILPLLAIPWKKSGKIP